MPASHAHHRTKAPTDFAALGIATAAIILFVGTGGSVVSEIVRSWAQKGPGPDTMLVNAMILNIALIIFGWRRYRELIEEIAERRRAEEYAQLLASTDPLTGCLNRRSMSQRLEELKQNCQSEGRTMALAMIDLDNFKAINDTHGHQTGDQLLVETVKRIRHCLPEGAAIARFGGDEFAAALDYPPEQSDQISDAIDRLIAALCQPFELGDAIVDVTVSIGVASSANDEENFPRAMGIDKLMHNADIAMYEAKKQGKNRCLWFEPTMANEMRFRLALENGIRAGIARGEFVPYYEQQIDLRTGKLIGFEMLARWRSPEMGLVKPDIFIPIAEEIGQIGALSESLMRQAFADARCWDRSLTLSVNISPVQMRDPWFAQKLLKLLTECRFPAHRLEIEITESCLHENIDQVRSMITSLRNQGIKISLDDFGTGYSSLEQLRSLPFDRLKIDRSFIAELRGKDASSKIVDAIISLGTGLNMPIIAEGIEDEEILALLQKMGELRGQGYFYGQPETADQVRERLTDQKLIVADHDATSPTIPEAAAAALHEAEEAIEKREGPRSARTVQGARGSAQG